VHWWRRSFLDALAAIEPRARDGGA
jgi:hypothetical protein